MFKLFGLIVLSLIACSSGVRLNIFHFNDIDAQLEAFKKGSDPPITPPIEVGGISRLIGELKRNEAVSAAAGEEYMRIATANLVGGQNGWLSVLGWERFGELLNSTYNSTVMGLGLREFESDLPRTMAYLEKGGAPKPLVSNIDPDSCNAGVNETKFCHHIERSRILEINGIKIGVVGFVNPTAEKLSDPGDLKFTDIGDAINGILDSDLKDVKTVIAIGSGSLSIAKAIIDKVQNSRLKVVIFGGISNDMTNDFPVEYNGKFIATGLKYGQAIGKIALDFTDGEGKVDKVASKLIPVAASSQSPPDLEVDNLVQKLRAELLPKDASIGQTIVPLEGTRDACWKSECNLGNLVADSMVYCAVMKFSNSPAYKTIAGVVAVWHSGAIFDDTVQAMKPISYMDVHKWLPYHNNAYIVTMTGKTLKKMFVTSGTAINAPENNYKDWGQFLQVSNGLEVKFSTSGALKSLRTLHLDDSKPVLMDVQDDMNYNVIIPSILYKGKSLYDYFPDELVSPGGGLSFTRIDFDDVCLENYITAMKVMKIGFEERIFVDDDDTPCPEPKPDPHHEVCDSNTAVTVILTLVIAGLIIGIIFVGWKVVWPRIQERRRHSSFP